jgi:hypothetical protein
MKYELDLFESQLLELSLIVCTNFTMFCVIELVFWIKKFESFHFPQNFPLAKFLKVCGYIDLHIMAAPPAQVEVSTE